MDDPVDVESLNQQPGRLHLHQAARLMEALSVSAPMPEKRRGQVKRNARRSGAVPVRQRLAVASRVAAALIGGYALSALSSMCLAQFLPLARAEAVVLAMTLSFLVYLPAVLWCFACRTAWRAWFGLLLPSAVLGAVYASARWLS